MNRFQIGKQKLKMRLNKKITSITLLTVILSCRSKNEDFKGIAFFPIIKEQITSSISIEKIRSFRLISDFVYPKHTYIVLKGDSIILQQMLENIHLLNRTDSNINSNSKYLIQPYRGESLWEISDEQDVFEDTKIRKELGISEVPLFRFAAYFNSGIPNVIFNSVENNWNGRILGLVKGNKCFIYIEELYHPSYKRLQEQ